VLHSVFTPCSSTNTRRAAVYGNSDCDASYPRLYRNLSCAFECPAGTFLDLTSGLQTCSPCPSGSFNLGGGQLYGGEGDPWPTALGWLLNECWVREYNQDFHNHDCSAWAVEDGALVSGQALENHTYTAGLGLTADLLRAGEVSVLYRKDTARVNGYKVGSFSVYVDMQQVLYDDKIEQATWKHAHIPLTPGLHEIYFEYRTMRSPLNPSPLAYIASISVTGTSFSSLSCYPCKTGGNSPGASSCDLCDFNKFWDKGACQDCPPSTFSLKGAIGKESCKPRPLCSLSDTKFRLSDCISGSRTKTYIFRSPLVCDSSQFVLPASETIACEPCSAGFYNHTVGEVSQCLPCALGEFIDSSTNGECRACQRGTFALRETAFRDWTELPTNFSSSCVSPAGTSCLESAGWVPSSDFLSSGSQLAPHSEIFLDRWFDVQANFGVLGFEFEFLNFAGGSLDVYVDGHLRNSWSLAGRNSEEVSLASGSHYVQWVYWANSTASEELRIHLIRIQGSSEGGASRCVQCEPGFVSAGKQDFCQPCAAGTSSNLDSSNCDKCLSYYYAAGRGETCAKCPAGTVNNANHTSCLGTDYAYFNNKTFYLGNITGRGSEEGTYNSGICNMPTAKLYCKQTFYGPIPDGSKEFYVSVLNPSILTLPNVDRISEEQAAFAYAVVSKKELGLVHESNADDCYTPMALVNLGRAVSSVAIQPDGFLISYSSGDICDKSDSTFSSSLSLICDKSSNIGWPAFNSSSQCSVSFLWRSKYGCPVCMYSEMETVASQCVDGVRSFRKIESDHCILPFDGKIEWSESCSPIEDVIGSWPMLLGVALLGGLFVLGVVSLFFFCKYKKGYKRLQEAAESST
jgi:hypothetical protein